MPDVTAIINTELAESCRIGWAVHGYSRVNGTVLFDTLDKFCKSSFPFRPSESRYSFDVAF